MTSDLVALNASDEVTLSPPNSFRFQRRVYSGPDAGTWSCEPAMPACNDPARIDVRDIEAAIAHPDVEAALALTTPPIYGDQAFADGPSFSFRRADGRGFSTKIDCTTQSLNCTPIPPGVTALVDLLRGLLQQQRVAPVCGAII